MFSCKVEVSIFIQDKVTKQVCKSKWFIWGEVHLVKNNFTTNTAEWKKGQKSNHFEPWSPGPQSFTSLMLNAIFSIYEQNILRFSWKISFLIIYFHYLLVPFSPNDFTMKWFFFFFLKIGSIFLLKTIKTWAKIITPLQIYFYPLNILRICSGEHKSIFGFSIVSYL